MYPDDMEGEYGDEMGEFDDKNDGLNALVTASP